MLLQNKTKNALEIYVFFPFVIFNNEHLETGLLIYFREKSFDGKRNYEIRFEVYASLALFEKIFCNNPTAVVFFLSLLSADDQLSCVLLMELRCDVYNSTI